MGTSHSPTETIVEAFKGTEYDTGLDTKSLLKIAAYFREVRKKYAKFESSFLGADTRILVSQVPGGMLSNLESQLKEQGAQDKIDDVLKEIAVVQKDCGYIPLVTPTSQIVGTQAVFNVLFGRYAKITTETADLVTGRYGALAAAPNPDLVKKALEQNKYDAVLTTRPADSIPNEFEKIEAEAKAAGANSIEDTLTYAMFPKVAPNFFKSRAAGPVSSSEFAVAAKSADTKPAAKESGASAYVVNVNGADYHVQVRPEGTIAIAPAVTGSAPAATQAAPVSPAANAGSTAGGTMINAPVAGTLLKHVVDEGASVVSGDTIIIIESMKMELEIKATTAGKVHFIVAAGQAVQAQQPLAQIG
jgi:oxaloacetate decarboxylase alpha subunit